MKTTMDFGKQKQEAIVRMKLLKLDENIILKFEEADVLYLSENGGMLFWLNETQKEYVKAFEQRHDAVVYHVIRSFTGFGELLSFLYVSKYRTEWKTERSSIKRGYTCAYVENLDDEECSEFGGIEIEPAFGGLVRLT